jgi:AcrR family transcriptional regulator
MAGRLAPQDRRAALLEAAGEVFASADYARAGVADVAALAGVSEALVFRYFPTKGELHAAVVHAWADDLAARQDAAAAAVPDGAPVRDRVRARLEVLLDDAADGARWWIDPGSFPPGSVAVVGATRATQAARLRELFASHWRRHDYALEAWPGFVEAAVRTWVSRGCPDEDRGHLLEASLGALQGALGDWDG